VRTILNNISHYDVLAVYYNIVYHTTVAATRYIGGGGLARVSAAADLFIDNAVRDVPPLTLNDYPVPLLQPAARKHHEAATCRKIIVLIIILLFFFSPRR